MGLGLQLPARRIERRCAASSFGRVWDEWRGEGGGGSSGCRRRDVNDLIDSRNGRTFPSHKQFKLLTVHGTLMYSYAYSLLAKNIIITN